MKTLITVSILLLFISFTGFAQIKFGLPKGTPDGSAILDLSNTGASSTTKKGFLGPQVALSGTADATTVPTPATGLMVYNTTAAGSGSTAVVAGYYYYNGTQWVQMVSSAAPASGNIYTADGTLTSARTVTMGTNALNFTGASGVSINTTTTSQYPLSVLQPLQSTPTQPGIIIAGASGSAVTGQSAFIAFNPNNISGAWPIIVGAQYVNGSANQSAADFIVATSSGGTPATKLVVQNGGNVGIGTTTPKNKLDVQGGIAVLGANIVNPTGNGVTLSSEASFDRLQTFGGRPLALNSLGNNVGIGTGTPSYNLHIAGQSLGIDNTISGAASFAELKSGPAATNTTVRLQSNVGAGFVGTSTNHDFYITSNGITRLTAMAAGNVGVGTVTPSAALHVNGTFKISDGTQGLGKVLTSDATGLTTWSSSAYFASGTTALYDIGAASGTTLTNNVNSTLTYGGGGSVTTVNITFVTAAPNQNYEISFYTGGSAATTFVTPVVTLRATTGFTITYTETSSVAQSVYTDYTVRLR